MTPPQEPRAPLVDALEMLGLVAVPAGLGWLGLCLVGGAEDAAAGAVIGGLFGLSLARLRREFRAVRTADGLDRRPRSAPEDSLWVRLADLEYDDAYDRVLAVALLGVGVAAFAAIPFVDPQRGLLVVWLVLLGVSGLTAALVTCHSVSSS